MEEQKNQQEQTEVKQENVKKEFKSFASSILAFFKDLLDIREGTDKSETIEKIKVGIQVKNQTAWVLVFSIIIASIGLNVSSTAVVIGAMLVSPLMGPILGVGLSIGINDIDTLRVSLKNLGIMVGLSVGTSFLFFLIPFFQDETPELLARTKPDVRDVLIAISGGLALIVALSRQKEMTNTIAGIAIATALMPPLCTAGYGLAIGNLAYFIGAMFLFIINSIFIALSTFVIVKFLRFPMVRYINSASRKRISQIATGVATIVFALSIYLFAQLFMENSYEQKGKEFLEDLLEDTNTVSLESNANYQTKELNLIVIGKVLTQEEKDKWINKLPQYDLKGSILNITQDEENARIMDKVEAIEDLYVRNQKLIATKDESLYEKDQKIQQLNRIIDNIRQQEIPFNQITKEAKISYEALKTMSISRMIKTDFVKIDTIPVVNISWKESAQPHEKNTQNLTNWLKARLNLKTLTVNEE